MTIRNSDFRVIKPVTTTQCRTKIANVLEDVLKIAKKITINLRSFKCDNNFENMFEDIKSCARDVHLILLLAEPCIVKNQIPHLIRKKFPKTHLVLYGNKSEFKSVCEASGSQVSNVSSLPAMLMDVASDIIIEVFLGERLGTCSDLLDFFIRAITPFHFCYGAVTYSTFIKAVWLT